MHGLPSRRQSIVCMCVRVQVRNTHTHMQTPACGLRIALLGDDDLLSVCAVCAAHTHTARLLRRIVLPPRFAILSE